MIIFGLSDKRLLVSPGCRAADTIQGRSAAVPEGLSDSVGMSRVGLAHKFGGYLCG